MSPERVAALVRRWAAVYTRRLPDDVAARRREELDADLHDQVAHERASGIDDRRIARQLLGRMARGVPADVAWRRRSLPRSSTSVVARIAAVVSGVLLLNLVLMLVTNEVAWGVFDFVLAGTLLFGAGLLLHQLATRQAGGLVLRVVAAVVGVLAMGLGEADDAPGLVGFGLLLLLTTAVLTIRTWRHSAGR